MQVSGMLVYMPVDHLSIRPPKAVFTTNEAYELKRKKKYLMTKLL